MSFGFGVGDFLAVGELAWKVYTKCKSSTSALNSISSEASGLHFVLKEVDKTWRAQIRSESDVDEAEHLKEGCLKILQDVAAVVEQYEKAGPWWRRPLDRMKAIAQDIAPLRDRLISNTVLLSALNVSLAQSSNEDRTAVAEANILEKLNKLQQDVHDGRAIVPAFTTITALNLGYEERWQELAADLQNAARHGLTNEHVVNDVAKELDAMAITSPHDTHLAGLKPQKKESPWGRNNERKPELGEALLLKLLQLKYPTTKGRNLVIKRVFWHLDWFNQGYLHRFDVEKHCMPAVDSAIALAEHEVMELVRVTDEDRDSKIDVDEFMALCHKLVTLATSQCEKRIDIKIRSSCDAGQKEANLEHCWLPKNQPKKALLPYGWDHVPMNANVYNYAHSFAGTVSSTKPTEDDNSFSKMAFSAARIWIPRISQTRRHWSKELSGLTPAVRDMYHKALQMVLDAAMKFQILESDHGPVHASDFDRYLHAARSVPFTRIPPFTGCPLAVLEEAQGYCYSSLYRIQGFVIDLKNQDDKANPKTQREQSEINDQSWRSICSDCPPSVSEWQAMRMCHRAVIINEEASKWPSVKQSLLECQAWFKSHLRFENLALECCLTLQQLKALQCLNGRLESGTLPQEAKAVTNLIYESLATHWDPSDDHVARLSDGWRWQYLSGMGMTSSYFESPTGQATTPVPVNYSNQTRQAMRSPLTEHRPEQFKTEIPIIRKVPRDPLQLAVTDGCKYAQIVEALARHHPSVRRYDTIGRSVLKADAFFRANEEYIDTLRTSGPFDATDDLHTPESLLSMEDLREMISGNWSAYCVYWPVIPMEPEDFSLFLGTEDYPSPFCHQKSSSLFFSGSAYDEVNGSSAVFGRANRDGSLWFTRIYSSFGLLFAGVLDPKQRRIIGKWGSESDPLEWKGSFKQVKHLESNPESTRSNMQAECAYLKEESLFTIIL